MGTSQVILTIAAILGGIGAIIGALFAIYKVARRIDSALGLDHKGRTLADRLDRVEHQLWENGGTSLADRVNRIEKCSAETATEVKVIKEFLLTGSIVTPPAAPKVKAVRAKKAS